ncbi:hypothetical protein LCGC14_0930480 [marine sediment metagenome]|uniref:Uncharacterized protein n=1 Tax=marine sediment metagenome TaxID=412755 RepID=A0A0F9P914_9ZZZZ
MKKKGDEVIVAIPYNSGKKITINGCFDAGTGSTKHDVAVFDSCDHRHSTIIFKDGRKSKERNSNVWLFDDVVKTGFKKEMLGVVIPKVGDYVKIRDYDNSFLKRRIYSSEIPDSGLGVLIGTTYNKTPLNILQTKRFVF